jgi:hypothetical protein
MSDDERYQLSSPSSLESPGPERDSGKVGIGVYLSGTTVAGLLPDSPASSGGLLKGDKIFKVDGESVDSKSVSGALNGSHGSVAVVEVRRSKSLSPGPEIGPISALQTLWDDSTASFENIVLRIPRSPLSPPPQSRSDKACLSPPPQSPPNAAGRLGDAFLKPRPQPSPVVAEATPRPQPSPVVAVGKPAGGAEEGTDSEATASSSALGPVSKTRVRFSLSEQPLQEEGKAGEATASAVGEPARGAEKDKDGEATASSATTGGRSSDKATVSKARVRFSPSVQPLQIQTTGESKEHTADIGFSEHPAGGLVVGDVQEQARQMIAHLQSELHELEEAARKYSKSSVLGIALDKGTNKVVNVVMRTPASRPLKGNAVEKGDELLSVNGATYIPGTSRSTVSSFGDRSSVSSDGGGSTGGQGDGGGGAEVSGDDRGSVSGNISARADREGRLTLQLKRARGGVEEVVCHLHKTLLETAADEIATVLEEARRANAPFVGRVQKAADSAIDAASLTDERARRALADAIEKGKTLLAALEAHALAAGHRHEELQSRRGQWKREREEELAALRRACENALRSTQLYFQAQRRARVKRESLASFFLHRHRATSTRSRASDTVVSRRERRGALASALEWWAIVVGAVGARCHSACQRLADLANRLALRYYFEGFPLMLELAASLLVRSTGILQRRRALVLAQTVRAISTWHAAHKAAVSSAEGRWGGHARLLLGRVLGGWRGRARAQILRGKALAEITTTRKAKASALAVGGWRVVACERCAQRMKVQAQRAAGALKIQRGRLLRWMSWMGSEARRSLSVVAARLRVWQLQRACALWREGARVARWRGMHVARMRQRVLLRCCAAWRGWAEMHAEIAAFAGREVARWLFRLQEAAFWGWWRVCRETIEVEQRLERKAQRVLRYGGFASWRRWCDVKRDCRRRLDRLDAARGRSTTWGLVRIWHSYTCAQSLLQSRCAEIGRRARRRAEERAARACIISWMAQARMSCRCAARAACKHEHWVRRTKIMSLRAWQSCAAYSEQVLASVDARNHFHDVELARLAYTEWVSCCLSRLALEDEVCKGKRLRHLRGALRHWQVDVRDCKNERQAAAGKMYSVKFHFFRAFATCLERCASIAGVVCESQRRTLVGVLARAVARWHAIAQRCSAAALRCEASLRQKRHSRIRHSLRDWLLAVDLQVAARRQISLAEGRLRRANIRACFGSWATAYEARCAESSSMASYANRRRTRTALRRWWALCVEGKEERHAKRCRQHSVCIQVLRAWQSYGRMCAAVAHKVEAKEELLRQAGVRATCREWQRVVHKCSERAGLALIRIRRRRVTRSLRRWRQIGEEHAHRRRALAQHIERASALRAAKNLRAILGRWESAALVVETPRAILRAKQTAALQGASLERMRGVFARWRSTSVESRTDACFSASLARARLFHCVGGWQAAVVARRDVVGRATYRAGRAAAGLLNAVWGAWMGVCVGTEREQQVKVVLGVAALKRLGVCSVWRRWEAVCVLRRGATALSRRVFRGAAARAWWRWRLHVKNIRAVELEIANWWEATSIRLMPLTYNKILRSSAFLVWKDLEDHAALGEEGAGGKSMLPQQRRHLGIRSRSAWYRLSRLVACSRMHEQFEAALEAWRCETARAHAQLLRIDQHARRRQTMVLACLLRRVACRRKIRSWQSATKRRCWDILKKVGLFERRLRFIESLACGQMFARKARVYLRHFAFGAWRVHLQALRRADCRARWVFRVSREAALRSGLAGIRAQRKLALARRSAARNHQRLCLRTWLRAWAQATWVSLRASDLPLLTLNSPPSSRRGITDATDASKNRRLAAPVPGTHALLLRLDRLDPFQKHPSQQLVSFLVGRMRAMMSAMAMREWASVARDNARVRRFQCRAIIRAKASDSMRALQQSLRDWHHIATRHTHIRFLSRTVSDILRAGDRDVTHILGGSSKDQAGSRCRAGLSRGRSAERSPDRRGYPASHSYSPSFGGRESPPRGLLHPVRPAPVTSRGASPEKVSDSLYSQPLWSGASSDFVKYPTSEPRSYAARLMAEPVLATGLHEHQVPTVTMTPPRTLQPSATSPRALQHLASSPRLTCGTPERRPISIPLSTPPPSASAAAHTSHHLYGIGNRPALRHSYSNEAAHEIPHLHTIPPPTEARLRLNHLLAGANKPPDPLPLHPRTFTRRLRRRPWTRRRP